MRKLQYWVSGPRLPILNLGAALITCAGIQARHDWSFQPETLGYTLDIIARVSVVYFLLTFTARPLNQVFHTKLTRWLQKNRRYFGLAFSAWFLQHLWLLPALGVQRPLFEGFWNSGKLVFPGVTILLTVALALTSFNRAQKSLPGWKTLHWIGLQALWLWFLAVYFKFTRNRGETYQYFYVALFIGAQALRAGVFVRELIRRRRIQAAKTTASAQTRAT
jgi:hypothetical protein